MAKIDFGTFVETVIKTVLVGGHKLLEVVEIEESHMTFKGVMSSVKKWLIMRRKPSVAILVYDLNAKKVVLVEQLRQAVGETMFEIPAGSMEADANPYTVARLELRQEIGASFDGFELIESGYFSPGGTDEFLFLFAVRVDLASSSVIDGSLTGVAKEGEDIRVHVVNFDQFFAMELLDFKTQYARLWLKSILK